MNQKHQTTIAVTIGLALICILPGTVRANGVLRDGAGAQSMALGGTSVAAPDEPLEAMFANPAGLGFCAREFQLGGDVGLLYGSFSSSVNHDSHLQQNLGGFPEAALVLPLEDTPLTIGLSAMPESASSVNWRFNDAPGGLGGATSYGLQNNDSEFVVIRLAFGASWKISDTLSIGGDIGANYNRNHLVAPYVFQQYPPLRGFKTLLDLETSGWGVNGTVGLVWKPVKTLSLGLSYRSQTQFDTHGDANGNADQQLNNIGLGGAQPNFHYDAEVLTKLPQMISGGVSWQAQSWVRGIFEVDWINWSSAFDNLKIKLTDGNNADINGVLGTSHFNDSVPLNWNDSFVYRVGLEFPLTKSFTARVGYAYGASPVPASTLTPMSAAIFENTFTCGLEWHNDRWSIAGAYQYELPATTSVGNSALESGEFSHSSTTVQAHYFALTLGMKF